MSQSEPTLSEQARLVFELRNKTGCGLISGKILLKENDWDIDKATRALIDDLRKRTLFH